MSDEEAAPVPGWPEESAQRLQKARALRALGKNPYPTRFERSHRLGEVVALYGARTLEELEALAVEVKVAGRVLTKRGHGKASFATIGDGEARLQIYVRQDVVGDEAYRLFDLVDLGDFVGVAGTRDAHAQGRAARSWCASSTLLTKALLPPPEKWHGLTDVEARYRQRYLDLLANPEVRRVFVVRSAMVAAMRRFLDERGYVEVETPMMQAIAGGAVARPFVTHHNALDVDLFLRIAPELYLKRLVVGGFERVYEINRNFRNEGISSMHNPEFTMLEFYTAYFDCRDVMAMTEELVAGAAAAAGEGPFAYRGRPLSFAPPFRRVRMTEAIAEVAAELSFGIDEAGLADPATLDAWLEVDERAERARRAKPRARGVRDRARAARPDVARPPHRAALRGVGREALGPRRDAALRADLRRRLSGRDLAARQGAPGPAGRGRPLRAVRGRDGDRQRLLRAQRPARAAPALPRPARSSASAATSRRTGWTRTTCARSATACRRRAAAAWASTGWRCCSRARRRSAT